MHIDYTMYEIAAITEIKLKKQQHLGKIIVWIVCVQHIFPQQTTVRSFRELTDFRSVMQRVETKAAPDPQKCVQRIHLFRIPRHATISQTNHILG